MRRLHLVATLALATALPLAAQTPQTAPRAIPLPDTMGANFDVNDTLTARSDPGDYDFMVGTWSFTFQGRAQNGAFSQPFTGHWVFTRKQTGGKGVFIEDHFRPDDPNSTWDAGTWTYRVFNPQRHLWQMEGVTTSSGAWQPGLMWSAGADRLLTEWYGTMLVRFRYFAIEPTKFLWRADATFDRGKTWIRDYWTMEVHRISQ
ncbi:MAG TPA: hypothetical protein VGM20_02325 [Gemmatimonadales bacterium]|jgi:hypothetical protein